MLLDRQPLQLPFAGLGKGGEERMSRGRFYWAYLQYYRRQVHMCLDYPRHGLDADTEIVLSAMLLPWALTVRVYLFAAACWVFDQVHW